MKGFFIEDYEWEFLFSKEAFFKYIFLREYSLFFNIK